MPTLYKSTTYYYNNQPFLEIRYDGIHVKTFSMSVEAIISQEKWKEILAEIKEYGYCTCENCMKDVKLFVRIE